MLLSYSELLLLVEQGVIQNAPLKNINAASIDITLSDNIMVEDEPKFNEVVSLENKESITMTSVKLTGYGYHLRPGEFILASSREIFNLPNDIVAEYVLKSTMARNGLNHMLAGYCDPGWHNSQLTLELKNETQKHQLKLTPGMKIGQVKFYRVTPVPDHASYATKGQYNNQQSVTASKGLV